MRILIVGSDANAYTIAENLAKNDSVDVVFVASESAREVDFAANISIAETDFGELLDFVVANEISLTIVTSVNAIENDIAGFFADARRLIFAPTAAAANIAIYRSLAKKMMYRLKIPTMKFGIFERENQAVEYASMSRKPLVIKNDKYVSGEYPQFTTSFTSAKSIIENSFTSQDNKIVIEDYIQANQVTLYVLTDGYSVLPIGSCHNNAENVVYAPDNCISDEMELKIIKETLYPVIDDIAARSQAYCGILGVDLLIDGDKYNVIEFLPFFKPMHLQTILPLVKSDLYDLFLSSACGSLSDEYECVRFYDLNSVSKKITNIDDEKLSGINDENFLYTRLDKNSIIATQIARTYSRAEKNLDNNTEFILKDGEDIARR